MQGVELWMLQSKDTAQVAEWIAELRDEGESLRDIAVLIPTLQSALDVLGRLEAQGLPARIVGGTERFYARLEIRDIANALRALSDPYDDFSLTALLRSPMAGLSLDSIVTLAARRPVIEALQSFEPPVAEDADVIKRFLEWFTPMSRDVDRPAAWEVISEVIERTQYLDALGRRRNGPQLIANVRKLLRLASRQPETGPMEFAEQIREIQQIGHREGDAPATDEDLDAVTILTVHKAKGLEFPVVIVPDLYRRLGGRMSDLVVEPWLATISTNYEGKMCLYHKWLSERTRSRERQEQDRVLYVALTRAKRRLCVCVCPSPQPYHMAGVISKHLGLPDRHYPGMVIRRAEMIARGVEPGSRSPAAER
jgi:ATP-dependent exoDNAse (exonuclease V) beta subunit